MRFLPFYSVLLVIVISPVVGHAVLDTGTPAPPFTEELCDINGLTGETYSPMTDDEGKVIFLQFSLPTCPGCVRMAKRIEQEVAPRFEGRPVEFVIVQCVYGTDANQNPYTIDQVCDFIKETGYTHPVVADRGLPSFTFSAYEVPSSPYIYILDSDGTVALTNKGSMSTEDLTAALNGVLGIGPPLPPAPPPCLSIECTTSCTDKSCGIDEPLKICAKLGEIPYPFDAYGVIVRPDGLYLSMRLESDLLPGVVPMAADIPLHPLPAEYTLLETTVPPGTPPGTYEVIVALTEPGTLKILCEDRITITVE